MKARPDKKLFSDDAYIPLNTVVSSKLGASCNSWFPFLLFRGAPATDKKTVRLYSPRLFRYRQPSHIAKPTNWERIIYSTKWRRMANLINSIPSIICASHLPSGQSRLPQRRKFNKFEIDDEFLAPISWISHLRTDLGSFEVDCIQKHLYCHKFLPSIPGHFEEII